MQEQGEEVFYEDNGIVVSSGRLVVSGVTYSMGSVSSIRRVMSPYNSRSGRVIALPALIGLTSCTGVCTTVQYGFPSNFGTWHLLVLLIGVIIGITGMIWTYVRAVHDNRTVPCVVVTIGERHIHDDGFSTTSKSNTVLVGAGLDEEELGRIDRAINSAMSIR